MWTRAFWLGLLDRSLKSAAQALLLFWGADGINVLTVSWRQVLGLAAGYALLSALTSIASGYVTDRGTTALLPGAK